MTLLHFEPDSLRRSLDTLGSQCRVAFAVACSLRAACGATPSEPLAETARRLAEGFACNGNIDLLAAEEILAGLGQSTELDRDDVASSYYALASAVKDDLDSAIWSAQRAYEARDAQAQEIMGIATYSAEIEDRILQREEVQNELKYQDADLNALRSGPNAIPIVIERAQSAA